MLPRMIRSRSRRIAAVIGRDQQHILRLHRRQEIPQLAVEHRRRCRIAIHIAPMTIFHIEIHQVHEAQAVEIILLRRQRLFHPIDIARNRDMTADAAAGKDIRDLADADCIQPALHERIQHRIRRRQKRKIMPPLRPRIVRICPHERARDHPPHRVRPRQDLAGHPAVSIKLLRRHDRLMRRDLQHAVRRRINDERACAFMLLPIIMDDLRPRIRLIAEHPAPESLLQLRDHPGGKPIRERRHRLLRDDPRDLPMPRRRILAARQLPAAPERSQGGRLLLAAVHTINVEHAQLFQIRSIILIRSYDGLQRMAVMIPELCRVRQCPHAKTIQHNNP